MRHADVSADDERSGATLEIRSYRRVFDLERRIYRVERLRLNPTGVPVRGIVYFLALLLATLLLARLPLLGALARIVPWYVRELAAPGVVAALLTLVRLEGRPFHLAALALLRYGLSARELAGVRPYRAADRRWRPHELVMLPDGSDSQLRHLRYTGPGEVHVGVAHVRAQWHRGPLGVVMRGADVTLEPLACERRLARGQMIALAGRARLEVDPRKRSRRSSTVARPPRRSR